jgi:hypothetical protein
MGFFNSLIGHGSGRSKAMTMYKRGMAKAKKHDFEGAIDDYSAAIDISGAPSDVIAMAMYNRALVHAAAKNSPKAIDDLNEVLGMADLPASIKSAADEKLKRINRRSHHDSRPDS